jgi:hypothetical protein
MKEKNQEDKREPRVRGKRQRRAKNQRELKETRAKRNEIRRE